MFLKYQDPISTRLRDDDAESDAGGGSDAPTVESLSAQLEAATEALRTVEGIKQENDRLNGKIIEANKHKKAAEKQAEDEARKTAEAEGNYKQLFESSEKTNETLRQENEEIRSTGAKKDINNQALKMASNLAEGHNIGILSGLMAKRLKVVDKEVRIVDENGNLTVSTLSDLEDEFRSSAVYASLVKGNQSSGGGATGSDSGSGATATMKRSDWNALGQNKKSKFLRDGGKLED